MGDDTEGTDVIESEREPAVSDEGRDVLELHKRLDVIERALDNIVSILEVMQSAAEAVAIDNGADVPVDVDVDASDYEDVDAPLPDYDEMDLDI